MTPTLYRVLTILCALVAGVPLGTNLGLVLVLWMLLTGRLLSARGGGAPGPERPGLGPGGGAAQLGGGGAGGVDRRAVAQQLGAVGGAGRRVAAAHGGRVPPRRGRHDRVLAAAPAGLPDPALQ